MSPKAEEYSWLELKPQQNFKDDKENKILEIIQSASEFAFFVFRKDGTMRIFVRTHAEKASLFRTIQNLTASQAMMPNFEGMFTKYLVLKNKRSLLPLLDPSKLEKSNVYKKMWNAERDSMMACFVCNKTEGVRNEISSRITQFESAEKAKGTSLSGRKKDEHYAAVKKRDGNHGYYNCCIVFGIKIDGSVEERAVVKESLGELDNLIDIVSSNRFKEMITRRRVRLSSEEKRFWQRVSELFHPVKTINPQIFVPTKLRSKSIVLTENELAYFISFPQEYDIQTINFEMGPNPTFMHGKTEDVKDTDLEIQKSEEEQSDDGNVSSF